MQTFSRITWIMSTILLVLLTILFASGIISLGFLIIHGSVLITLLAAGIASLLLEKASGIIRYAGIFCTWAGFLVLASALYKFIELKDFWQTGLSLLAIGLICGIYAIQKAAASVLKSTGIVATLLLIVMMVGVIIGINTTAFYTIGAIALTIFSLTAIVSSIQRPSTEM